MLAEIALYLATPVSQAARRNGFLTASVALWSRATRCRTSWEPHIARCRAAVLGVIPELPRRRTVVVLGSGLLQDVPIEELVASFDRVVLIDAVHLASVRFRAWANRWSKVEFVTRDLSGYDELLNRQRIAAQTGQTDVGGRLDPLAFVRRMPDVDLVISANLLSQLGIGVVDRLSRPDGHAVLMPEDTPTRLVQAHVDSLAGIDARTLLLTDVHYELRDRTGRVIESFDMMHGARLPLPRTAWEWTVAPFGEEAQDVERVHRVKVIDNVALELR